MVKGPAGFSPELGDWWFAVTDAEGVPMQTDAGTLTGPLVACSTCHLPRDADDYLFGVPASDHP
jgi:hypothetical protein